VLVKGSGKRPEMQQKVNLQVEYHMPEHQKILPKEELRFIVGEGDVVTGKSTRT